MRALLIISLLTCLALLAGCGGGPVCCADAPAGGGGGGGAGGGGGVIRPGPVSGFISFRDADEDETLSAPAIVQRAGGGADFGGTANFEMNDDDEFDLLEVAGAGTTAAWSGDELACSGTRCRISQDDGETKVGRVVVPDAFDWNYQTFGHWIDDPGAGGRTVTAFSFGNPTPAGAGISRSEATYNGRARGIYEDEGTLFELDARMRAEVDFRDREIEFSTSGTRVARFGSESFRSAGRLDMEGDLSIGDAYRFSGRVRTDRGGLEGVASGRFYGPEVQEIGGTFTLSDGGEESITGAFGGRRSSGGDDD